MKNAVLCLAFVFGVLRLAAETLTIDDAYLAHGVPEEGVSCDALVVRLTGSTAQRLTGGKISVAATGSITVESGTIEFANSEIEIGAGTGVFDIKGLAGTKATYSCVLSGTGRGTIALGGEGTVYLKGVNTFDNDLLITNRLLYAMSDHCFGSAVGKTSHVCLKDGTGLRTVHYAGCHVYGELSIDTQDSNDNVYFDKNTTNVFEDVVDFCAQTARLSASSGSVNTFKSDVKRCNYFGGNCSATFEFFGHVTGTNFRPYGPSFVCTFHQSIGVGYFNAYNTGYKGGTFYAEGDDILMYDNATRTYVSLAGKTVFDLRGHFIRTPYIETKCSPDKDTNITSAEPTTLMIVGQYSGAKETTYDGKLTGNLNLVVAPDRNNVHLTLSGTSSSIGDLAVSNAHSTVTLSGEGSWAGTNVYVAAGGTLNLLSNNNFGEYVELHVDAEENDGTVVNLNFSTPMTVNRLFVNGVEQNAGYYGSPSCTVAGATQLACFGGTGAFNVLAGGQAVVYEDGVWTGAGADDDFLTAANWEANEAPEHLLGMVDVTFAKSGTRAELSSPAAVKGVVFTNDLSFTLATAAAAAAGTALTIGGDGVVVQAATDAATDVLSVPITLGGAQTWRVGAKTTLMLESSIASLSDGDFGLDGKGTTYLNASNAFDGAFSILDGTVYVNDDGAFGTTNAGTRIVASSPDLAAVYFNNTTNSENFTVMGGGQYSALRSLPGTTNTFYGSVTAPDNGRTLYLSAGRDSLMDYRGGITCSGYIYFGAPTSEDCGTIRVADKPITCLVPGSTSWGIWNANSQVTFRLAAPSNHIGDSASTGNGLFVHGGARVFCDVPYALDVWKESNSWKGSSYLTLNLDHKGGGRLDISGGDQAVWGLICPAPEQGDIVSPAGQRSSITSSVPATLTVKGTATTTSAACFDGQASLTHAGTGTLTMTGESLGTGTLTVEAGTVILAETASWTKGVIRLKNGVLSIPSGCQRCRELHVWSETAGEYVRKADGIYTSADGLFTGSGQLRVGKIGLMLLVR